MNNVELIASYWTLAGGAIPHTDKEYSTFDFKDRVDCAARVGFKGLRIWHSDLEHILNTRSLKEMRQILDDNGMQYVEIRSSFWRIGFSTAATPLDAPFEA
jgi:sugar phosphate isomerase/epimerase